MKKWIACILIGITAFLCASCTASENVSIVQRDGQQCLVYQDEEYYASSVFKAMDNRTKADETLIKLGWYYSFPFSTYFYSETAEKPVFIFAVGGDRNVYLRKDYDYKAEVFVIADTSKTIVFSEALTEPDRAHELVRESGTSIRIVMHAQKHPDLELWLDLTLENDYWYASLPKGEVHRLSEAFVNLLKEAEILT